MPPRKNILTPQQINKAKVAVRHNALKVLLANKITPFILNGLQKQTNPELNKAIYTAIWKSYPCGIAYHINYYMNTGDTSRIDKTFTDVVMDKFIDFFLDYLIELPIIKNQVSEINNQLRQKMKEEFGDDWTEFVFDDPMWITIGEKRFPEHILEKLNIKTKEEVLNFFKTTLINSFNDEQITSVSSKTITLYRGIVGFDIHNPEQLKQILHPRAFSSTSPDISVAIRHTGSEMTDRYQTSEKTLLIVVIHLPPGIKYIDYNKLIPNDDYNKWQNEIILPPGLTFIPKNIKKDEIDTLEVDVSISSSSFGKVTKRKSTKRTKIPSKIKKLAKKYKIKLTIKRGNKRIYKSLKVIKKLIKQKIAKKH